MGVGDTGSVAVAVAAVAVAAVAVAAADGGTTVRSHSGRTNSLGLMIIL